MMEGIFKRFGYTKAAPQASASSPFNPLSLKYLPEESRTVAGQHYGYYESAQAPENDEDFLQAYNVHAWLYAGVNAIARNCAKVPLRIYRRSLTGTRELVTSGWAVNLLQRPNRYQSGYKLLYATSAFLTLAGDAFLEKNSPTQPTKLWVLMPTKIKIRKDPKAKIGGYEYTVNGSTVIFRPDEVVQFSQFNPLSEYFGTSSVSPLSNTLTSDFYAQSYEKAFFQNGGHLSGVFTAPKELEDKIFERLRAYVLNTFTGQGKNHKIGFFDGGVEFKKMSTDPKEADLGNLRNFSLREILAVLGVPRMLVQDSQETAYANAEVQLKIFWGETMQPHMANIEETFNNEIFMPNGLECAFDYSSVEALRENKSSIIDLANKAVQSGLLTINEARKEYMQKEPVPWGNVARFPINLESTLPYFSKRDGRELPRVRGQYEKALHKIISKYMKGQLAIIEGNYKNAGWEKAQARVVKAGTADTLLFKITGEQKQLIKEIMRFEQEAGQDFYEFGWNSISKDTPPAWMNQERKQYMEKAVEKFAEQIDKTTLESLRGHIDKGISENKTMPEIMEDVREVFAGTVREAEGRAWNIARTEMLKVENYAALKSFGDAGAKFKTWLASGPPEDRENHTAMDGETVPIDEPFSNGLQYPGDPSGPPEEICNCRCNLAPATSAIPEED